MRTLGILLGFVFVFQSCDVVTLNDNSTPEPQLDESISSTQSYPATPGEVVQFLSNSNTKQWQASGFTIEGLTGFQPCRMDDQIVLNADGTYEYSGGEALCGAEDNASVKTGKWSINFEDRIFTVDADTDNSFELIMDSVSEDEVVLTGSYFGLDIAARFSIL